jgi:hypothetical protein
MKRNFKIENEALIKEHLPEIKDTIESLKDTPMTDETGEDVKIKATEFLKQHFKGEQLNKMLIQLDATLLQLKKKK